MPRRYWYDTVERASTKAHPMPRRFRRSGMSTARRARLSSSSRAAWPSSTASKREASSLSKSPNSAISKATSSLLPVLQGRAHSGSVCGYKLAMRGTFKAISHCSRLVPLHHRLSCMPHDCYARLRWGSRVDSHEKNGRKACLESRKPASFVPCTTSSASSSRAAKMYSCSSCSVLTASVRLTTSTCREGSALLQSRHVWQIPCGLEGDGVDGNLERTSLEPDMHTMLRSREEQTRMMSIGRHVPRRPYPVIVLPSEPSQTCQLSGAAALEPASVIRLCCSISIAIVL